jgi:hypothetical protein
MQNPLLETLTNIGKNKTLERVLDLRQSVLKLKIGAKTWLKMNKTRGRQGIPEELPDHKDLVELVPI